MRGGDQGTGNYYLMGTKFQFSVPEKNLEMDNIDGCATLCMYLMSLDCTLKIATIFMYVYFTT